MLGGPGGTWRDAEPGRDRMVQCCQCVPSDMGGLLAPTARRGGPPRPVTVQLTQLAWDNRHALVARGADTGVLGELRDNRRQRPLHGHSHPPPYASPAFPLQTVRRGEGQGGTQTRGRKDLPGMGSPSSLSPSSLLAEPAKFEAESATSGIHKSVALDAP
jgi:hypothetical protein